MDDALNIAPRPDAKYERGFDGEWIELPWARVERDMRILALESAVKAAWNQPSEIERFANQFLKFLKDER